MRVKEVKVSDTERFVICHNPNAATRDAHLRAQLVAQLDELIAGSDSLPAMKRGELRGEISTKPGLNRYLRVTPGGLLRVDKAGCKTEANLDGKYLLRCSARALSAADIALGYKQLLEVERGWRDMKQILDLRPVHHRLEKRIRAHVVLCWLALLLIRIIDTTTGDTWPPPRAVTSTGSTPAPSPAPPARSASAPRCPSPTRPARPARHPRPDPDHRARHRKPLTSGQHHHLETRPERVPRRVPAAQHQDQDL